jgi:hypothetical protein
MSCFYFPHPQVHALHLSHRHARTRGAGRPTTQPAMLPHNGGRHRLQSSTPLSYDFDNRASRKTKSKQAKQSRRDQGVIKLVGWQSCTCAHGGVMDDVAQPVGLQQHRRWRSPVGTASQVEEAPLNCMFLLAVAGNTTDGSVVRGKKQRSKLVMVWTTEFWPELASTYLNSCGVSTCLCEST